MLRLRRHRRHPRPGRQARGAAAQDWATCAAAAGGSRRRAGRPSSWGPDRPWSRTGQGRQHRALDDRRGPCALGHGQPRVQRHRLRDAAARRSLREFLRPHSAKNVAQHAEFLRQVGEGSALHREMVEWFKSLPPDARPRRHPRRARLVAPALRRPGIRRAGSPVVRWTTTSCTRPMSRDSPEWMAMEGLTKGLEITSAAPALVRGPRRRRPARGADDVVAGRSRAVTAMSRSLARTSVTACLTIPFRTGISGAG